MMISVIMPAYNTSKFIEEAIESILNQTIKDFELIIVDDGSTDKTVDIINQYAQQDSRIRVIEVAHSGMAGATNVGVKAARYPWLAFADSDDIAVPSRLEKQLKAAETHPHIVGWGSYFCFMRSTGQNLSVKIWGPVSEQEFDTLRRQGKNPIVYQATLFVKKEIFMKEGGYLPKYQTVADVELIDRLGNHGPLLVIPEPLVLYRLHPKNTSIQNRFNQWIVAKYLNIRHQARLAGYPVLSFEAFLEKYRQHSWLTRLRCFMSSSSFFYQKAGVYFFEKEYITAFSYLGLSMLINPLYALPRIWQQLLSPQARRLLKNPAISS
ncbi:MAG: glycosyltransferase family 2 protein [Candidatus Parabeggiatoa sp. nov. 3]|nr:MAG: glycosyltransferase family 2 protein [Gammaproteobacteria bacterium]